MTQWRSTEGGVTAPRGFLAGGIHAGIKPDKPDLALIVSERPAVMAGTFTTNRVQAAPVRLCRERLAGGGEARMPLFSLNSCQNHRRLVMGQQRLRGVRSVKQCFRLLASGGTEKAAQANIRQQTANGFR